MSETVQTAVTAVTPKGRKPFVTPAGKTLTELRTEAAAAIKTAKAELKAATAHAAAMSKTHNKLAELAAEGQDELTLFAAFAGQAKKDEYLKTKVKGLKEFVKNTNVTLKASWADVVAATKAVDRAQDALTKAEAARDAVEASRTAK